MTNYRRIHMQGKTSFFTVVTYKRIPLFVNRLAIDTLLSTIRNTQNKYPFHMDALCILPDHIHCIWTLPENVDRSGLRWASIKAGFSKTFAKHSKVTSKPASASRAKRRESGYWQRRFWEHVITSEENYRKHFDYVHYNPVKHGLVTTPQEWQYSTLMKYIQNGVYDKEWDPYLSFGHDEDFGE